METHHRRILFVSNSYPDTVSGVTAVVGTLLQGLQSEYKIGIICPNSNTRYSQSHRDNVSHYHLPSYPTVIRKDVRFITPNPLMIQKAWNDFQPDIVHFHDPSPASVVIKDLAVRRGVPFIFSHHFTSQMVLGYLPDSVKIAAQNNEGLNNTILQLACRVYEGAKYVITPTEMMRSYLAQFTNVPIRVISSGIDMDTLSRVSPEKIHAVEDKYRIPSKPFVMYVGRLDPEKNLPVLLHAWATMPYRDKYRLVMVGGGAMKKKLIELTQSLNISSTVKWTGIINHDELPALYANSQVRAFVMPSPTESQSIVTLMALGAGIPVIAADAGALPELIVHGKNGFLCDPYDAAAFREYLQNVLEHPETSKKIGGTGRLTAVKHDLKFTMKKYRDIYARI